MRVTFTAFVGMHAPGAVVDVPEERAMAYIEQGVAEAAQEPESEVDTEQTNDEPGDQSDSEPGAKDPKPVRGKPAAKRQTKVVDQAPVNKAEDT